MKCLSFSFTSLRLALAVSLAGLVGPLACSYDQGGFIYEAPPNADPLLGCNGACHGDAYSVAPPGDLQGNTDPTSPGIGAHRVHLQTAPGWHLKVECVDCHVVPETIDDPGHMDGDDVVELTFSQRATNFGAMPTTWENARCTNSACHGAATTGGAQTTPLWTDQRAQSLGCNDCHGFPPPPPHDASDDCGTCHTTVLPGGPPNKSSFLTPNTHINGTVETIQIGEPGEPPPQTCYDCHGSLYQPNPPSDLDGNTDVSYSGVGAHQAHVGTSNWRRLLYCDQCHDVPVNIGDPGHIDGDGVAEVRFDALNPNGTYANNQCSNLYCHGNGRNQLGSFPWNVDVLDLDNNCTACHSSDGNGMSGRHQEHLQSAQQAIDCEACHVAVIGPGRNFVDPELHINGNHDVEIAGGGNGVWDAANHRCQNGPCHNGNKQWFPNGNFEEEE